VSPLLSGREINGCVPCLIRAKAFWFMKERKTVLNKVNRGRWQDRGKETTLLSQLARLGHGNACNSAFCGPAQVAPLCN